MGEISKIEWTDATWNPVTGCAKLSEGCAHCYAFRIASRFGNDMTPTFHPERLEQPLHWKAPRKIFVCSMADIFHESIPRENILKIRDIARQCPRHTFIFLTKRNGYKYDFKSGENIFCGVTIENDKHFDRLRYLAYANQNKFVSFEPLLGSIKDKLYLLEFHAIKSVIVGGESGQEARPMNEEWVREIRDYCIEHCIRFFYKQRIDGGKKISMPKLDGKIWDEDPFVRG